MCHAYVNFSVALQMIENWEWLIHQIAVLPCRSAGPQHMGERGREVPYTVYKAKCRALQLGRNNCLYPWGRTGWEATLQERTCRS